MKNLVKNFVMMAIAIITVVFMNACTESSPMEAKVDGGDNNGMNVIVNVVISGSGSSYTSKTNLTLECLKNGKTTGNKVNRSYDTYAKGNIVSADTIWSQTRNLPAFVQTKADASSNTKDYVTTTTHNDVWTCGENLFHFNLDYTQIKEIIEACFDNYTMETGFTKSQKPTYTREFKGKVKKNGIVWAIEKYTYSIIIEHFMFNNTRYDVTLVFNNFVAVPEGTYEEEKKKVIDLKLISGNYDCEYTATLNIHHFYNDGTDEKLELTADSVLHKMNVNPMVKKNANNLDFGTVSFNANNVKSTPKQRGNFLQTYVENTLSAVTANGLATTGNRLYTLLTYSIDGVDLPILVNAPKISASVTHVGDKPSGEEGDYDVYAAQITYVSEFAGELNKVACKLSIPDNFQVLIKKKTWKWAIDKDRRGLDFLKVSENKVEIYNSWAYFYKLWSDNSKTEEAKHDVDIYVSYPQVAAVDVYVNEVKDSYTVNTTAWSGTEVGSPRSDNGFTIKNYRGKHEMRLMDGSTTIGTSDRYHYFERPFKYDLSDMLFAMSTFSKPAAASPVKLADNVTINGTEYEQYMLTFNYVRTVEKQTYNETRQFRLLKKVVENTDIQEDLSNIGGSIFVCPDKNIHKLFGVKYVNKSDNNSLKGIALHYNNSSEPMKAWSADMLDVERIAKAEKEGKRIVFAKGDLTGGEFIPCTYTEVKHGNYTYYYCFSLLKGGSDTQAIVSAENKEWNTKGFFDGFLCKTITGKAEGNVMNYTYTYPKSTSTITESIQVYRNWNAAWLNL